MQTARPSLRSNFAWTFAGNVVNGASQWAILSILAKLGSTEMLGQYALAVAVTTPVAMLSHLNLRAVLATDIAEQHPFADYMRVRVIGSAAGVAVIGAIALVMGYGWPVNAAILFVGLSLMTENVSDLYYGLMQRRERMDFIARSMIVRGILSVVGIAAALFVTRSLVAAMLLLAGARIATAIFYDRANAHPPHHQHTRAPFEVLRTALPLGVVLMLISLTTNLPRYAVERYLGTQELGAFAAVASFVTIGSTMINALGQSATTRLAEQYSLGHRAEFRRLATRLIGMAVALGAAGVLVAWAAGKPVLTIVYRAEFATFSGLLVVVLAAGTISYVAVMLGYVITATRAFAPQMPLLMIVAATSAMASWILVPRLGLNGAAAAIAIASGVQILGQAILLRRSL